MKIKSNRFKISLALGAALVVAIFITRPAFSQESAKKDGQKKIVMKIVTNDNGTTTITDTTMEMSDDAITDSVQREVDKVILMHDRGKRVKVKVHSMPQGYSYDFDLPPLPDCPMALEDLEDIELEGNPPRWAMESCDREQSGPGPGCRVIRRGEGGQSLNDMLGNIPMDRVVGYTIKDRKHGKRIVIDLNDAPMFERQERVIVIREPGRMHLNRNGQERQMRVVVDTDDDKGEVDSDHQQPPSVPPPPPPPPPDSKSPKK